MVISDNGYRSKKQIYCHLLDVIMRILLFEEVGEHLSRSKAEKVRNTLFSQETDAFVPLNSSCDLLHKKGGNIIFAQELWR